MDNHLFANEHYPVDIFVRAFAVKDFPAAEAGNLLLDGLEFDVQLVGKGFPGQRGVIYQGVDDMLGRLAEGACLYSGTFCGYRGSFSGYRVFFFISGRPSSRDEMAAVLVMFIWPFLAIDYQSVMRNSSHLSHDYWPFFWSFACLLISLSPISTALVINAIWLS